MFKGQLCFRQCTPIKKEPWENILFKFAVKTTSICDMHMHAGKFITKENPI